MHKQSAVTELRIVDAIVLGNRHISPVKLLDVFTEVNQRFMHGVKDGGFKSNFVRYGLIECFHVRYLGKKKMARSEGFEPPTAGLEGRCSIQLSYERAVNNLACLAGFEPATYHLGGDCSIH